MTHTHDPVRLYMKSGEVWLVCRTCGARLDDPRLGL